MLDIQIVYSVCADTMIPTSYELLSPGTGESHCALPVRRLGVTCGPIPFGRPFWSRCVALPAFRCRSFPSATWQNLRRQNNVFSQFDIPPVFFSLFAPFFGRWEKPGATCNTFSFQSVLNEKTAATLAIAERNGQGRSRLLIQHGLYHGSKPGCCQL